ncbi:MAG: efflux RND transporter permease subunit [Gammaproteobacteria bacterium]|nr:efflux RND transporter permease subunit [Gammaproteobacteria bacterium]
MLARLIAFSLRNAALVTLASAVLVGLTWYALQRMPVDVFPELNAPTVTIITESGGLTAEEVEQYISFPVESAINGLPELRRVRSASSLGLSIVWAEFGWGVDIYRARQMVAERLDTVKGELPADAHLQMTPVSSITGEIMLIALHSEDPAVSPLDLRAYAEFDLRNRLLTISGVSQVVAIGGYLPEYQVEIRQEALQAYGLTSGEVAEAVAGAHNLNTAGFLVNVQGLELPLRQSGRVRGVGDIEQTVVAYRGGAPVTVADVADVRLGGAFRRGAASDNGEPAVVLSIQKATGTNTLALTERVDALLDQIEPALPAGIKLNRDVFRQAAFIDRSVDNVTRVLYEATVIVTLILVLFLMNLRTTVITLAALPVSLAVGLLVMWAADMSINVMTLGGLAVAIGILVDDAIIYVENVYRRLGENAALPDAEQRLRMRVIYDACREITNSVVFATIIICIVFVPLLFLQGLEGRFFQPLAITYIISVMASLLVAMTLTPALCWYLLRGRFAGTHADGWLVRQLKRGYRPLLGVCLRFKGATLSIAALLTALTLGFASTFGTSFLPQFNEGTYTVFLMMPPGTSLEESERVALGVEKRLLEIDGIEHAVARSGRAERDEHAEPPSSSELEVRIAEDADPQTILDRIDAVLAGLPGVTTNIGQPISHRLSHVLSGTKAQIAINVYGPDLAVLRRLAKEVESALAGVPGTRDVSANREVLVQTLAIDFRLHDLARYGLSAEQAGAQVKRALFGDTVAVVNQGVRRYDLTLRLVETQRDAVDDVHRLVLSGRDGALVRLHEVADIGPEQASNLISRQNAQRKTVISANVASGHNLGDTVAAIRTVVDPIVHRAGYTVEYGGQFQAQQSASRTILGMGGLILLVMLMLLQMALGGLRPAILVMVNLPLAMIGGVVAMFLAESADPLANLLALLGQGGRYVAPVISIASLVGFITLFGIAVRNGILLVNHFRWLIRSEAMDVLSAVRRGSEERLVPVLMTALCAALGLIPLALKIGEPGSELLAPLAIVVLGGLITSTLLNMLVVPVGYLLFCRDAAARSERQDPLAEAEV